MRAFFCLELEAGLKERISSITERLSREPVRANWVPPENLHVTLLFLGEIGEDLVPPLREAAEVALRESGIEGTVEWELTRLGAFPQVERPRVVWVGSAEPPEPVKRLASELEGALAPLGFAPERREFAVHVTLGRVKERGPQVQRLTRALETHEPFSFRARANALTLMKSRLTPKGAVYEPIFRLPFLPPDR